jgi:hypothetical protein
MLARSPQLLAIEAKLNSSCDDTVVDARAVCGHSRIKLLIAASVVILIVGCAPLNPEKVLGSCWNVNDMAAGRVAGKAYSSPVWKDSHYRPKVVMIEMAATHFSCDLRPAKLSKIPAKPHGRAQHRLCISWPYHESSRREFADN